MATVQDTYNAAPGKGFPGQVDNGETSNRISRTCEDAAGIGFGKAVFQGGGDHGCTGVPSADFLGVAIADHGIVPLPGGVAADIYPQRASVGIMTQGAIKVLAGANVAKRDPVYVTPGNVFTNVNGGGANFLADGWEFDETVSNGEIVRLVRR